MKQALDMLACPACKCQVDSHCQRLTPSGKALHAYLYCTHCSGYVGEIKFGKADFFRHDKMPNLDGESQLPIEFNYRRIPWNAPEISSEGLIQKHLGWTPEGFGGSLYSDGNEDWKLSIWTCAIDLAIRCVSGDKFGMVDVVVDGGPVQTIDFFDKHDSEIVSQYLYRNRLTPASAFIQISPSTKRNSEAKGRRFCFSGIDVALPGAPNPLSVQINRGNCYPDAYHWILNQLPREARVLDCGSGDRTYGDSRVLSFEFLPFELPDIFGDGHALPFLDTSFDAVFSQAVIEHMSDPFLAAREIFRILKPGGLVYAESAFMQPLHAVPYHFFNTTPLGIKEVFSKAGFAMVCVEWFGSLSASVRWFLDASGGKRALTETEYTLLFELFDKVDASITYEQLKPIASAVAFWGMKPGGATSWPSAIDFTGRPSYRFGEATEVR
jgi:SAM-dependent methyltransferase